MTIYEELYEEWNGLQFDIESISEPILTKMTEKDQLIWLRDIDRLKHRIDEIKLKILDAHK